jgi:hypothetical protein
MSSEILLPLVLLAIFAVFVFVPVGTAALLRGYVRPKPPSATPARSGLVFQRHVAPASRVDEMRRADADRPPMFANAPAALDGEIAPDRLSSSSSS